MTTISVQGIDLYYESQGEGETVLLLTTFAELGLLPLSAFDTALRLMELGVPRGAAMETLVPWAFSAAFLSDPKNIAALIEADQANLYPQSLDGYRSQLAALRSFDSRPYLPAIRVPVHAVATGLDLISPHSDTEEIVRLLPGATSRVLPGIGHAIQAEQPKLVSGLIREWVAGP